MWLDPRGGRFTGGDAGGLETAVDDFGVGKEPAAVVVNYAISVRSFVIRIPLVSPTNEFDVGTVSLSEIDALTK